MKKLLAFLFSIVVIFFANTTEAYDPYVGRIAMVPAACVFEAPGAIKMIGVLERADWEGYIALVQDWQNSGCIDSRIQSGSAVPMVIERPLKEIRTASGECLKLYLVTFGDVLWIIWPACEGVEIES